MMSPLVNPRALNSRLCRAPLHKVLFLLLDVFIRPVMIKHCIDNGKYPETGETTVKVLRLEKYAILIENVSFFACTLKGQYHHFDEI